MSFTETIKLVDEVSAPAKAAGEAVLNFGQRMALLREKGALAKASTDGLAKSFGAMPGATKKAAEGLENLTAAMLRTQAKSGTGKADAVALAKATAQSERAKASAVSEAAQKQIAAQTKMANTLSVVKDAVGSSVEGMKNAFKSLASGDVQGAIAGVTDSIAGMAKLLDLAVPGLGQAAAAVIQIAGGLVGITVGLIKSGVEFAIVSSEAKQQMLGLFDAMGGGLVTGAQTEEMIDGVKAKFGIAKDALIGYTNQLQRLGVTDLGQLEDGILALASASALVKGGDEALLSFRKKIDLAVQSGGKLTIANKQLAQLSATGANVGDVAKVMGVSVETLTKNLAAGAVDAKQFGDALQTAIIKKGQGPLERMAASSANLKKLLSEAWGDLFEDIDVAPFMAEVKKLFDIFGQGTKSGEALKAYIGGFFKQVFALLTKVVPMVRHFLLSLIILGLKAYIAIKPIIKAIKDFAASAEGAAMINTVLEGLWTVLQVVGVMLMVVVGAALLLWGAMIAVSVAVWTVVGAVLGFVGDAGAALLGWVASAATAAYDFVAGLVSGITSGASMVIGAVTGLADSATGAFKSALGIASPSRVMMTMGGNMTDGVSAGLEGGASDVQGSAASVADASVKGMSAGGASSGSSSKSTTINVTVAIDGAGKSAMEITQEMVSQIFQRMALEQGV